MIYLQWNQPKNNNEKRLDGKYLFLEAYELVR